MSLITTLLITFLTPLILSIIFYKEFKKRGILFKTKSSFFKFYFGLVLCVSFITMPLYFFSLHTDSQKENCEAKNGVFLPKNGRCVKTEIYNAFISSEATIKID